MHRPLVRSILALFALLVLAGAGYKTYVVERQLAQIRDDGAVFDGLVDSLISNALEMRAAELSYVADGQGPAAWETRVAALADSLKQDLPKLRPLATTADTTRALNDAAAAMATAEHAEQSARAAINNNQRLAASDFLLGDALDSSKTLISSLGDARVREHMARDRERVDVQQTRSILIFTALAMIVAVLLALVPVPRSREDALAAPPADSAKPQLVPAATDMDEGIVSGPVVVGRRDGPAPSRPVTPPNRAEETSAKALTDAAELCADLARVGEAQQLPGLLERTATLLNASGIIIWVQDPTGQELRPAISHGYSPQVLARLQAIPRDADNATAAAFRAGELRIVESDALTAGALVVPIMTERGAVGAMAAEIRGAGEKSPTIQALATIVAAQMATLVPAPTVQ